MFLSLKKIKYSVIIKLASDTLLAIKTVGLWSVGKLYISTFIDRFLDSNNKYDVIESLDPRETIPNHPSVTHATIYVPTRARPFLKLLNSLDLNKSETVFVDFGCGKGRALLLAADFGIKNIKGIEFCNKLSAIAVINTKKYLNQSSAIKIEIINTDMSVYEVDPSDNLFYFYNPCDEFILKKVIKNIIHSLSLNSKMGTIIYQNNTINYPIFFNEFSELSYLFCRDFSGNKFFVFKIN
mgnify:CR=1 FL=1